MTSVSRRDDGSVVIDKPAGRGKSSLGILGALGLAAAISSSLTPASPRSRSPYERNHRRRARKDLIDPPYQAPVHVTKGDERTYVVRRDGTPTHLIMRTQYGWHVLRVKRDPSIRDSYRKQSGLSIPRATAREAAKAYGLVFHKWSEEATAA